MTSRKELLMDYVVLGDETRKRISSPDRQKDEQEEQEGNPVSFICLLLLPSLPHFKRHVDD